MPAKPLAKPQLPKKTRRNQPAPFTETIAMPLPEAVALPRPHMSPRLQQGAIMGMWVLACIALGVAYGMWLSSRTASVVMPGIPVAQANLTAFPSASSLTVAAPVNTTDSAPLMVVTDPSVAQAQAGNPVATASLGLYQPALAAAELQPGFLPFGYPQGTVGTAPVR